ncbi:EamA family transporter RarD [Leucobacter sp. CSA1]|uniref:EamA family transporter RarD n=1 Tax=Leucobacter chromiisoli TaxID=2796471 RepID=A0A934QAR6_9MICO|nr:EamA family transporter RarD [Leucobacter chromiisoli]MBK0419739.1 EamA family transporter RarD [Leucobacter chromiisoli]
MNRRAGYGYGLTAYLLWGVLPLYFVLLGAIDPFEVVAGRILLTLVFCGLLLTVLRQWGPVAAILRDRSALATLAAAGLVIYVNWQVFVIASFTGHVVDASLGYFINPVVTVLFGVALLGERLTAAQWGAVGVTVIAFVTIAIGYGTFPWIAVLLACSFGLYGYLKRKVGADVPALPGLFVETLVLSPLAVALLALIPVFTGAGFLGADGSTLALFSLAGIATAIPLLLFAAAARRLPLVALGFIQYVGPTVMLLIGWLVLGERIPPARWIGFGLVWAALVLLSADGLRRRRARP